MLTRRFSKSFAAKPSLMYSRLCSHGSTRMISEKMQNSELKQPCVWLGLCVVCVVVCLCVVVCMVKKLKLQDDLPDLVEALTSISVSGGENASIHLRDTRTMIVANLHVTDTTGNDAKSLSTAILPPVE